MDLVVVRARNSEYTPRVRFTRRDGVETAATNTSRNLRLGKDYTVISFAIESVHVAKCTKTVVYTIHRRRKHGGNGGNCPRTLATTGQCPRHTKTVVVITVVNNCK